MINCNMANKLDITYSNVFIYPSTDTMRNYCSSVISWMTINCRDLIGLLLSGKSIIECIFDSSMSIILPYRNKLRNLKVSIGERDKVRGYTIITGRNRKRNIS